VDSYFTLLPQESLLHFTGPDAAAFLQGQTTCDTRKLDRSNALPGAYCTHQGRVICDFLLAQLGADHLSLRMRREVMERAATTFGKYIVFSKAKLETGRDDWTVAGCWGANAATILSEYCEVLPSRRYGSTGAEGFVLVQLDDEGARFECYLNRALRADLANALAAAMQPGNPARWQLLDIAAGFGRVEAATMERFVPQMLNYDLTGHISFNKGCYTGQEVVARLHYRGKPKRRMYLARVPAGVEASAGDELYVLDSDQSVGTVANSADDGTGAMALVVATAAGVEQGLHLHAPAGALLRVERLPYSTD